jgi:hypothetical protein
MATFLNLLVLLTLLLQQEFYKYSIQIYLGKSESYSVVF